MEGEENVNRKNVGGVETGEQKIRGGEGNCANLRKIVRVCTNLRKFVQICTSLRESVRV